MLVTVVIAAGCSAPVDLGAPPAAIDTGSAATAPRPCASADCLAPVEGHVLEGHRVRVDDSGGAYVSFVETRGLAALALWITYSPRPGSPLAAPVLVPTLDPPLVGGPERPGLAVAGDRVALAHTGAGDLRHGDASVVYGIVGTRSPDGLRFDPPAILDQSNVEGWVVEHALPAWVGDDLWLLWKRQVYGFRDLPTVARRSEGFAPTAVSDGLSRAHECSPPDVAVADDGTVHLALRSQIDGVLHTVVLSAAGDAFAAPVQLSRVGWAYSAEVCPEDGPRVVVGDGGEVAVVWAEPADGGFRTLRATSIDGGRTWAEPVADHAAVGSSERWPTVAVGPDGRWWTAFGVPGRGSFLVWRDGIDATAGTPVPVVSPEGDPLRDVEIAGSAARLVAVGRDDHGRLWLVEP